MGGRLRSPMISESISRSVSEAASDPVSGLMAQGLKSQEWYALPKLPNHFPEKCKENFLSP
jgi:hypothetical protein